MIKTLIRKTAATLVLAALASPAAGQDLIARQAPVDVKMRAVDSVEIQRLVAQENIEDPANDLYPDWNAAGINIYGNIELPQEYKIDLRHFCMPIDNRIVTSGYGYRPRFKRQHRGIDIDANKGDTIRAAFDGKIRVVDFQPGGYGNVVVIRHPNGLETIYGHLSKQLKKQGDIVKAGDAIGLAGNTGRSFGTHLHFETRLLGAYINPALMFDFAAQDVKGDYFIYRRNGHCTLLAHNNVEVADDDMAELTEIAVENTPGTVASRNNSPRANKRTAYRNHKVRKGETLSSIARKHGTTVKQLCRINGISQKTKLRPGQILKYS